MIIWLTGNSGAGKTTLAHKLKRPDSIMLDGDDLREVDDNKDMSKEGRWRQNLRVAKLAKLLESQGFQIIVAVICPYEELRRKVEEITNCTFVYLGYEGDNNIPDKPYERPSTAVRVW